MVGLHVEKEGVIFIRSTEDGMLGKTRLKLLIGQQPKIPVAFQHVLVGNAIDELAVFAPCAFE